MAEGGQAGGEGGDGGRSQVWPAGSMDARTAVHEGWLALTSVALKAAHVSWHRHLASASVQPSQPAGQKVTAAVGSPCSHRSQHSATDATCPKGPHPSLTDGGVPSACTHSPTSASVQYDGDVTLSFSQLLAPTIGVNLARVQPGCGGVAGVSRRRGGSGRRRTGARANARRGSRRSRSSGCPTP